MIRAALTILLSALALVPGASARARGDATAATADPLADAYLWIKPPGESDGACNGGPEAGAWWPEYALGLAQRAPGDH